MRKKLVNNPLKRYLNMNSLKCKVTYLSELLNTAGAELPPVCTSTYFIFSSKTDYMTTRVKKLGGTPQFSGCL